MHSGGGGEFRWCPLLQTFEARDNIMICGLVSVLDDKFVVYV